jgi:CDGSH-type Zn-finger protein
MGIKMSENIKMRVKENGSIRVTGTVDFVDADGNVVETKTDFSLCRCGHSKEKPYCDGSHKAAGFEAN